MNTIEIRITGISNRKELICNQLPLAKIENDDVVIQSKLEAKEPLNEHLVWLWNMLKGERRFLKSIQAEGAKLTCNAKSIKPPICIKPNAAEMLHLLNIELILGK